MSTLFPSLRPTRRRFLVGAGVASATLSLSKAYAQPAGGAVRKDINTPEGARDLERYKQAVGELLALPPEDPRNWHRLAFIHMLDCPHGNWWFLVWHRGYLGWVERICRDILGEPDFALPFWDWTRQPVFPDAFYDGVLNVNGPDFLPDLDAFRTALRPAMQAYWNGMSPEQATQQALRPLYSDFDDFWGMAEGFFAEQPDARGISAADPDLLPRTAAAVRAATVRDALISPRFATEASGRLGFESVRTPSHHLGSRLQSILESQPHNLMHRDLAGFMGGFLSPVDPIFFMHHCNIDRLWDVWTRKQIAAGMAIGPEAGEADAYFDEPFLFFVDEAGAAVEGATARDYFSIDAFAYSYAEGFGEALIAPPPPMASLAPASADGGQAEIGAGRMARVNLTASPELTERLRAPERRGFFATVTITPENNADDFFFDVLIGPKDAPEGAEDGFVSAGGFAFFGPPHGHGADHAHTFTVSISEALQALRERGVVGQELEVLVTAAANPRIGGGASLEPAGVSGGGVAGALQAVSIGEL